MVINVGWYRLTGRARSYEFWPGVIFQLVLCSGFKVAQDSCDVTQASIHTNIHARKKSTKYPLHLMQSTSRHNNVITLNILPWPKKRTIFEIRGEKNAVPRVISCSIKRDQRRAKVADSRGSDLALA